VIDLLSQKEKLFKETKRDVKRAKKMKDDKIYKKIEESFSKLNNKNCYAFLGDEENNSHHNLLDFLMYLEKACQKKFGKSKKYSKEQVMEILAPIFPEPTKAQHKTLNVINKHLKENKATYKVDNKITRLYPGKDYVDAYNLYMDGEYDDSIY
jgi:hypothetical protein